MLIGLVSAGVPSCANWSGEKYALRYRWVKGRESQRLLIAILVEDNGPRERNVWLDRQYSGRLGLSTVMRLWFHFQPRILTDIEKNSF